MQTPPRGRCFECILPLHAPSHLPAPGPQQPPSLGFTLVAPPYPQVAGEGPHPREAGALPPPRPHPGSGNKVRRRREKADTQAAWRAGTMPTALCPQPQPPGPPAPGAGTHPKPPSSCHLALPHLSVPLREGTPCPESHSRYMSQLPISGLWGSASHTSMVPPGSTHLRGYSTRVLSGTSSACPPVSGGFGGSGFTSP